MCIRISPIQQRIKILKNRTSTNNIITIRENSKGKAENYAGLKKEIQTFKRAYTQKLHLNVLYPNILENTLYILST